MKTAVVILNWNGKNFLKEFLPGLVSSLTDTEAEVVVADNASTDGSLEFLSESFPQIKTIPLEKNYGFTGGYNRAFKALEEEAPEYFLLINSDIEVSEDWYPPLEEWMDLHEDCAACAPKLHAWQEGSRDNFEYAGAAGGWIDHFGYPFCRGRVMQRVEQDNGQYDDEPAEVLWATGACLMVRSSVWKELGGLDERFFAHMEEIDFCWRARNNGYRVNMIPRSLVYHVGGGTLPQDSPFKLYLNFRNNLLMLENNLPYTEALRNVYDVLSAVAAETAIHTDDVQNCLEALGEMEDGIREKIIDTCVHSAYRRTKGRIFFRMVLDGCSALVYLFSGKTDCFKAVIKAHKDYRRMSERVSKEALEKHIKRDLEGNGCIADNLLDIDLNYSGSDRVLVNGILDESIVLLNYTAKDSIFEYLRDTIG